jgi:hypothetical protein
LQCLAFWRTVPAPANAVPLAWCQLWLGHLACDEGDFGAARERFREMLTVLREVGHREGIATHLVASARWAAAVGQPERAARLLAAATALREARQHPWPPVDQPDLDDVRGRLRAALPPAALEALTEEGRRMGPWPAVALALEALTARDERSGESECARATESAPPPPTGPRGLRESAPGRGHGRRPAGPAHDVG